MEYHEVGQKHCPIGTKHAYNSDQASARPGILHTYLQQTLSLRGSVYTPHGEHSLATWGVCRSARSPSQEGLPYQSRLAKHWASQAPKTNSAKIKPRHKTCAQVCKTSKTRWFQRDYNTYCNILKLLWFCWFYTPAHRFYDLVLSRCCWFYRLAGPVLRQGLRRAGYTHACFRNAGQAC